MDTSSYRALPKVRKGFSSTDSSTPGGDRFLFINKDANSLSRSPAEVYAVGSHVSKGSRKWRRPTSSLDLDQSTGKILVASGVKSPRKSRTPSPARGQPKKFQWRVNESKDTSARPKDTASAGVRHRAVKSATTSPDTSSRSALNGTTVGPTAQSESGLSISAMELLQFYVNTIRPFALSLNKSWLWIDDLQFVLSSPALVYAINAYASAFKKGVQDGMHSLALPPQLENEDNGLLWPTPEWFTYQAQTISFLRSHLETTTDLQRPIQKAELHAMLFLMRLQILLGDRDAALMHLNAIKKATEHAAVVPDFHIDFAFCRISLLTAYKNQSMLMLHAYTRSDDPTKQDSLIEFDYFRNTASEDSQRLRAHTLDRIAIWQNSTFLEIRPNSELVEDLISVDGDFRTLQDEIQETASICAYVSRRLLSHLLYLNADTSLDIIRALAETLQKHVTALFDVDQSHHLPQRFPRLMFYILFAGVFANRGYNEQRAWFIAQMIEHSALREGGSCETMIDMLSVFLDPSIVHQSLLSEVWNAIVGFHALWQRNGQLP